MVNSLSSSTAALTDVLLEGSRHLHGMGAPWEEILPVLRQERHRAHGIRTANAPRDRKTWLRVLNCAEAVGFDRGFLTAEILEDMLAVWRGMQRMLHTPSPADTTTGSTNDAPANTTAATDLGRTIAPIHELQNHWTYDLETTSQTGRKAISVNKQRTHRVIFWFITTSLETAPLRGK